MNGHVRVRVVRWSAVAMLAGLVLPPAASAQHGTASPGQGAIAETPPIECWWRTSRGAVRVGEPFSLVLTCAVVENDSVVVVPDQTRLDRGALQVPPFDVIGGTHPPDLRSGQRRFFQYAYTLRIIGDDVFGKDVELPALSILFRIQSRVQEGSVQGRDLAYVLPPASIRVLSIVPNGARDLREPPLDTFDAIEARTFRANMLLVMGGALLGLGALTVLTAAVQLLRRSRRRQPDPNRLISDAAILSAMRKQLAVVRRRADDGWTGELAVRAAAALRIAGGFAVAHRISQRPAATGGKPQDGQLVARGGWLRGKRVLVSSSVTAALVGRELARGHASAGRRQRLEALQTSLVHLNAAQFGREATLDSAVLDESLTNGRALLRRLRLENLWPVRTLNALRASTRELGSRVWSR